MSYIDKYTGSAVATRPPFKVTPKPMGTDDGEGLFIEIPLTIDKAGETNIVVPTIIMTEGAKVGYLSDRLLTPIISPSTGAFDKIRRMVNLMGKIPFSILIEESETGQMTMETKENTDEGTKFQDALVVKKCSVVVDPIDLANAIRLV